MEILVEKKYIIKLSENEAGQLEEGLQQLKEAVKPHNVSTTLTDLHKGLKSIISLRS